MQTTALLDLFIKVHIQLKAMSEIITFKNSNQQIDMSKNHTF